MSNPAALAALPGLIRATRLSVEENAPVGGAAGIGRALLVYVLFYAEDLAEGLVRAVPEAAAAPRRPPQQIHAPIGESVEPLVPRWASHDGRLPPGRPHP